MTDAMISDDEKRALFDTYAQATRTCDPDLAASLYSDGVVLWHNFDESEVSGEAIAAGLKWIHSVLPDVEWADGQLLLTADGFVWKSTITGTGAEGAVREPTCLVVTLDGEGKICRMDEYIDSPWLTPLMRRT